MVSHTIFFSYLLHKFNDIFDLSGCNFRWHGKGNRWSASQNFWRCANWSSCNYTWEYKNWWMCDDSCWLPCVTRCSSSQVNVDELLTMFCFAASTKICFVIKELFLLLKHCGWCTSKGYWKSTWALSILNHAAR